MEDIAYSHRFYHQKIAQDNQSTFDNGPVGLPMRICVVHPYIHGDNDQWILLSLGWLETKPTLRGSM